MLTQNRTLETRSRVMSATREVIQQGGLGALTLEAVAKQAGISKGGLLHHFPSKDALIDGLLRALFAALDEDVARTYQTEREGRGRWLRAYTRVNLMGDSPSLELIQLLATLFSPQSQLTQLWRQDHEAWLTKLTSDGLSLTRVIVIKGAADSYWLNALMGQLVGDRDALLTEIFHLIDAPDLSPHE